jgi:hypothetical protein
MLTALQWHCSKIWRAIRAGARVADLIAKFSAWDKVLDSHWSDWRAEARECFAMLAGDQVKKVDQDAAADSGLFYAVLNKIDPTISAICGSEITNRQEVRYFPRQATQESAAANEVLSAAAEWTRDECDASDEESEAFRDCVTCGMGWTETRMSYDLDPDGIAITERVDPLEMCVDASARRPNAADSRYLRRKRRFSKAEAAERFDIDPDQYGSDGSMGAGSTPHNADLEAAYQGDKGDAPLRKDEIEVTEYQWYEMEECYRVLNPQTGEIEDLTEEEYAPYAELGLQTVETRRRCYYRAYRIGEEVLQHEKLPEDEFTLKCVTGKLDRNKGVWYGVVRSMIDPQRLLNKQVSQLQRIIDVNAKGGLLAEVGAFEDPEQAKADWAASDTIVYTKDGAVAGGRVVPKPVAQYPSAIDKMFGMMNEMVPGVSGVNNEMLGVIDREQAGVVDWQRKQAAYGVLAGFFNSLRRYRRMQGRLLLKLITKYMSDGRLVRIMGKAGDVRYVQLAKQPDTLKYDVIVDEAPAGPNQKERTFLFLTQFGPMLQKMGLPPQIWLKMMEYSPLPSSLVSEIQQMVQNMPPQEDPKAAAMKQKLEFDMQAKQQELQAGQQEAVAKFQLEQAKTQAQIAADAGSSRVKAEVESQKAEMMAAIKQYEAEGRLQIETAKMTAQAELQAAQFEFEKRMQEREAAFEERMRAQEIRMQGQANGGGSRTQFGGDVG